MHENELQKTTTPTDAFLSYDSGVFCHVTLTQLSQYSRFPISRCHSLLTENTPFLTKTLHAAAFLRLKLHSGSCFTQVYLVIRLCTSLTCQTEVDSQHRRLPGRPLCSPCEHLSSRRGWVGPARPQRQHGPAAQLASGLQSDRKGMNRTGGELFGCHC